MPLLEVVYMYNNVHLIRNSHMDREQAEFIRIAMTIAYLSVENEISETSIQEAVKIFL